MTDLRIPFAEAIGEPRLLKPRFEELSLAQQVALKVAYGAPLSTTVQDDRGWSEMDYWAMMQEEGDYDELGRLTEIRRPLPYHAKEYREVWGICGIRAGKTELASFITCYEAACGGHEGYIRSGRQAICFQIAQDLRLAKFSLHSIRATLEKMAFLTQPWGKSGSRITNLTADRVELWNGMVIACIPPTVKSIRGYDSPVAVLDEVGVWYQEEDSANPDFEIYRAVSSRQAQFAHPKIVGISSPWNKGGLLYARYLAGTEGRKLRCDLCRTLGERDCPHPISARTQHQDRLILHSTTAGMGNPLITDAWLVAERAKDPRAFERECLARFQDSLSGFLPTTLLEKAVDAGVLEHPPEPAFHYIAALDPAFRRDAFGFAIAHADPAKGIVIDVAKDFRPRELGGPLNPQAIFDLLEPYFRQYKIVTVCTDQYQYEALNQLALSRGFVLERVPFTAVRKASIFADLKMLVTQGRLRIPDDPELMTQLASLEMKLSRGVQITSPERSYDDLAVVVALAAHKAIWLLPKDPPKVTPDPTIFDLCQATIKRRYLAPEMDYFYN